MNVLDFYGKGGTIIHLKRRCIIANQEELAALEKDRGAYYGDPKWNHENIGIVWGGLLRAGGIGDGAPVPSDLVALMLGCGLKGVRAAQRKPYHKDNYDDHHVYLDFSGRFKKEDQGA